MSTDLPPAPVPAPAPAPAKKSNTLVIVLCVVFGILFLLLASCVGTCMYVGKKAKKYAQESQKYPQISALALAASLDSNFEVVSKDLDVGTLSLKNKKTGEVVKLDAKDFSAARIGELLERIASGKGVNVALKPTAVKPAAEESAAASSSSETNVSAAESAAQDDTLKNFRSDFPIYSDGSSTTVEAAQNTFAGVSTSIHVFLTSDSPAKVAEYFEKKLAAEGYTVLGSENGSDSNGATLSRVFQKGEMGATLNVTARVEGGKTHVEVNQVVLKQP